MNAIKPVGMRGGSRQNGIGRGIGKINNITTRELNGEVYFEIHPKQLKKNLAFYQESLIVEIYGGIEFGLASCDEGIMLGKRLVDMTGVNDFQDNFEYMVVPVDDYNQQFLKESIECHPRSSNGKIAAVIFTLKNPFYYNEKSASIMNLWYPARSEAQFGSMEFCIRLELIDPTFSSADDDFDDDYFRKKNVTSLMDTKFKVEIMEPDARGSRYQEGVSEVKVYSNQDIGPTKGTTTFLDSRYEEVVPEPIVTEYPTYSPTEIQEIFIPIQTYLCSSPDESDTPGKYNPDRTYRYGQTFRLCVGPVPVFENTYKVVGFESVICSNMDRNVTIIDEYGVPDEYTTLRRNALGFTRMRGGVVTSTSVMSINSVITSNLAGIFSNAASYFVCSGSVILELKQPEIETQGGEEEQELAEKMDLENTNTNHYVDPWVIEVMEEQGGGGRRRSLSRRANNSTIALQQQKNQTLREKKSSIMETNPSAYSSHRLLRFVSRLLTNENLADESNLIDGSDEHKQHIRQEEPPNRQIIDENKTIGNDIDDSRENDNTDAVTYTDGRQYITKKPEVVEQYDDDGQYSLPIVGELTVRVDLSGKESTALEGTANDVVNNIQGWFQIPSSSAGSGPITWLWLVLSSTLLWFLLRY